MALLSVKKLYRSFGGLHAIEDVSFTVEQEKIKAIIGPNGAGKTTLFNLISGRLHADAGEIFFYDNNITGLKPFVIAARGICSTFQNTKLFPHMTVLDNVMVGRHIRSKAGFLSCMLNLPWNRKEEKTIKAKALETLKTLDLIAYAAEYAGNLAFGKQRLVEFARALATEPSLLLLDEPAAGLNIYETKQLAELIVNIRNMGITILVVEHDMSLVMDISDEIIVLDQGHKLAEGKPEEIQNNTEVIKVYLGEDSTG